MSHNRLSQVLGAFWYLFSIERESTCWQRACGNTSACHHSSLYCDDDHTDFIKLLNDSCPIETPNTTLFDFGIFHEALKSGVVESMDFPQKFFYCFWWGLQNLRYAISVYLSFAYLPACLLLILLLIAMSNHICMNYAAAHKPYIGNRGRKSRKLLLGLACGLFVVSVGSVHCT